MEEPQNFRVQTRHYPRAGGMIWRWWVFDHRGGTHLDTGIIIGGDRGAAEQAASDAVERLGLLISGPRGVGHNTPRTTRL